MKSARDRKIRDEFEFTLECFAQYMLTGKVRFGKLPKSFRWNVGRGQNRGAAFRGSDHDYEYYNQMMEDYAENMGHHFLNCLNGLVGRILVM